LARKFLRSLACSITIKARACGQQDANKYLNVNSSYQRAIDALSSSGLTLKRKTAAFAIALLLTKLMGSFHERLDFII